MKSKEVQSAELRVLNTATDWHRSTDVGGLIQKDGHRSPMSQNTFSLCFRVLRVTVCDGKCYGAGFCKCLMFNICDAVTAQNSYSRPNNEG